MNPVRLVRLLDGEFHEKDRIAPEDLTLTWGLEMPCTARLLGRGPCPARPGDFCELFTLRGSMGYYRVRKVSRDTEDAWELELEHGIMTLNDRVLPGRWDLRGHTGEILQALLALQSLWTLGTCEADWDIPCTFENVSILSALRSMTGMMDTDFVWTFDMASRPWKLNLMTMADMGSVQFRRGVNLESLRVTEDLGELTTRVWPLGAGEGGDQVRLEGNAWMDGPGMEAWGLYERVLVDRSVDSPAQLRALGENHLRAHAAPVLHLEAQVRDTEGIFVPGMLGMICPDTTYQGRIRSLCWPHVYTEPERIRVEMGGERRDTGKILTSLARTQAAESRSTQGAPSEYGVHFGDNADPEHPAVLRFFLDAEAVRVNRVQLRYRLLPFRGYARSESAGGSGTMVSEGISATVVIPARDIQTGYAIPGVTENRHTHFAEVPEQTLNVRILSGTLESAMNPAGHVHPTVYGICEPYPAPDTCRILVDGAEAAAGGAEGELDVLPHLQRDGGGEVTRDAWHGITFVPGSPGRVEADVHVRTYIRCPEGARL